ncbi:MAG: PEGA domain-containing protein, partial [Polyangiaceae bacterium]|nr:PEGA domain-containing protein [Polyangiaceae bacterium]
MEKIAPRRALRPSLARPFAFALALATPALAAPPPASPSPSAGAPASPGAPRRGAEEAPTDPVKQARVHYERCIELYSSGSTEPALVECERAYELAPSHKILYNVGIISKALRDYAGALRNLEHYLAEGGDDVSSERRAEVERIIAQLSTMVATVDIQPNVDNAELYVDDVLVGKSPLRQPVRVNPGRRKVSAAKAGYVPATKIVAAAMADSVRIHLTLSSLTTTAAPAATPSPPDNPWATRAWVGWGVTGLLAAGAGVTGALALNASHKLDQLRDTPNASGAELDSKYTTMKTLGLSSDVLLGSAVVAAGLSTWFTIRASQAPSA